MTLRPRLPSPPTQVNPNQPTGGGAPIDPFPGTPAIPQPPPYQWFIPNDTSGGPEATPTPREPLDRTVKVSRGAEGRAIPIAYGACQVTGEVFCLVGYNGALIVAYALSLASGTQIEAVDSYTLNGYASPVAGVTVETYLGNQTGASAVSPILSAAISGYTQRHPGLAFMVVQVASSAELFGGIPQLRANVRGRRVYDHRSSTTAYRANPALCARDLRVSPDGGNRATSEIDETSVDAMATMCDVTVSSVARFTCGYAVQDRRPLREHIKALLDPASLEPVLQVGGTWGLAGLVEGASPGRTITQDDLFAEDDGRGPRIAEERPLNLDQIPTALNCRYYESTREYEDMAQTARAPYVLAGTERLLERDYSARSVVTAPVAARVAGDRLNMAAASGRLNLGMTRDGLKLLRGEIVGCQGFLGLGRTCLQFDGVDDYCSAGEVELSTQGSVEVRFRCTGSGAGPAMGLISTYPLGYQITVISATGLLNCYFSSGDSATGLGYDLRDGLAHHVAVTRGTGAGARFIVYLDGEEIHNAAASATSAASAATATIFGAANATPDYPLEGTLEEVRIWNDVRTQDEIRYYQRRALSGAEAGLIGLWRFDEGTGTTLEDDVSEEGGEEITPHDSTIHGATWTTRPEYYVVGKVQPRLDAPQVDVELAEWWPRSRATANVQSTGGTPTARIDTRTALPRNDPQGVPPAPAISSLTVEEDIVGGSTRYKLILTWVGSASGFVRGYRIRVTANGVTRTLPDTGRLAEQSVIDVLEPGYEHVVGIKAVGITGQLSTEDTDAITPGNSFTVTLTATGSSKITSPIVNRASPYVRYVGGRWGFSVATTGDVARVDILVDGRTVGSLGSAGGTFELWTAKLWDANIGIPGANFVSGCEPGSTVTARAISSDGQTVDDSETAATPTNIYALNTFAFDDWDLLSAPADGSAGEFLGAVGASPDTGSLPRFASGWHYDHADAGVGTIDNGNATEAVSFGCTFAAAPGIGLAAEGNEAVWVSSVSTTGFTLNRSGTSGSLSVRWVAFGD
ncbi:MAG: hypothetical protein HY825_13625 [Acidobacteria bacterium]|nr:hypothetical protein [Acidobacteriota bacterium]